MENADCTCLDYGEMLKSIKKKYFVKALLLWQMAPYMLLYDVYKHLFRVSAGLTDDDGKNIEKILWSGQRSGVRRMKSVVTKDELTGMDVALNRMRAKSSFGITVGKKSSAKYEISVEYKETV